LAVLSEPALGAGAQAGFSIPGATVLANLSHTTFASRIRPGSRAGRAEVGHTFVSLAGSVRVAIGAGRSRKHDRGSGNVSWCHVMAGDEEGILPDLASDVHVRALGRRATNFARAGPFKLTPVAADGAGGARSIRKGPVFSFVVPRHDNLRHVDRRKTVRETLHVQILSGCLT